MSELQDQQLRSASEALMRNIDFEILCETLELAGWTRIKIDYVPDRDQAWNTVMNWADENFKGEYQEHNGTWLIENAKDATMFALKWKCK